LLEWCDASDSAPRPPRAPRHRGHKRSGGGAGAINGALPLPLPQPRVEAFTLLAASALALMGDWLSWVCVASMEAFGVQGAAAVGEAVEEVRHQAAGFIGAVLPCFCCIVGKGVWGGDPLHGGTPVPQ
jgi:hypothetical protein